MALFVHVQTDCKWVEVLYS